MATEVADNATTGVARPSSSGSNSDAIRYDGVPSCSNRRDTRYSDLSTVN